jgi:hypothetical protein
LTASIPLVVIIAVVVIYAYRHTGLRVWHALLCMLCGFLIAATTAGPGISSTIAGIVQWLTGSRP